MVFNRLEIRPKNASVKGILRHLSDFQLFLQFKAFEGYPDKPGPKDVAQNATISLTDIGEKLG
jgi:hypothetical protein